MNPKSRSIKEARNRKRQTLAKSGALLLGLYLGASFELVLAGPTGGEVVRGEGSIGQSGATTTISQQSQRLLLEWQTFNVAANEHVLFNQPGSTAVALNRILDQNASEILGAIDANGRVFLINPNGIIFGTTATVNVGALVASSLDLNYDDFMAGNYDFQTLADGSPGVVVNRGLLQASTGGSVTLMGGAVSNEGLIVAELGQVTLAAGSSASLDFDGDGLLFFEVTGDVLENTGVLDSAVSNSGEISADGGQVLLTASAAKDVFSNVVNNEGLIRAQRIDNTGGVIRLVGSGGDTISNGVLDASAADELSTGGDIQILGDRVGLFGDAVVDANGATGGGTVKIGGGFQGKDPTVSNAARTFVGSDVHISADAGATGNGGEVIVWSDEVTRYYGNISARGGSTSGNGGFVEVSGKEHLDFDGNVVTSAVNGESGTLLLDPASIFIIDDVAGPGTLDDDLGGAAPQIDFSTPDDGGNTLTVGTLVALGDTNIELQATDFIRVGDSGGGSATVDLSTSLTSSSNTLTLSAGDGPLSGGAGAGDVIFNAGSSITTGGGGVTINAGANGDTSGNATLGAISTNGGAVTVNAIGSVVVAAAINAGGGQIDISVDTDEATTDGAESLEIQAALTAAAINLDGGAATKNDTLIVSLTGGDSADWDVNLTNAGTLDTSTSDIATFTNFSSLTGGNQVDTFTFDAVLTGTASGLDADDTFTLNDGGSANIIEGGTGTDNLSYANRTSGVNVDMAVVNAIENLTGSGFDDTFELNGDEGNDINVDGGAGSDIFAVVSDSQIAGDLSISNVETVTNGIMPGSTGGILSANLLSITGASSGIGSVDERLETNVDDLVITGAGNVFLDESNALSSMSIDSTGNVSVETGAEMVVIRGKHQVALSHWRL